MIARFKLRFLLCIVTVILTLFLSVPAFALFINGGFETGDATGWTVEGGGFGTGNARVDVIDNTGTMAYQNIDIDPYNGTYMARIGDVYGSKDWTRISQTDTISQQDIDDGAMLFINWGAVLVDPIYNPHGDADTPFFSIDITVGGITTNFERLATDHTVGTVAGNYGASTGGEMWYWQDMWSYDLSTYSVGDAVSIDLYARDCGLGGHGGYAFLDGIGTTNPTAPVPEPATMLLFGTGLAGIVGSRLRKKKKQQ